MLPNQHRHPWSATQQADIPLPPAPALLCLSALHTFEPQSDTEQLSCITQNAVSCPSWISRYRAIYKSGIPNPGGGSQARVATGCQAQHVFPPNPMADDEFSSGVPDHALAAALDAAERAARPAPPHPPPPPPPPHHKPQQQQQQQKQKVQQPVPQRVAPRGAGAASAIIVSPRQVDPSPPPPPRLLFCN